MSTTADAANLQAPRAIAHARPLSVLLADDYEANRMIQKAQVEQLGYAVDAVANGEEVLRALHARFYDVVLLDIRMPVMNGLETARRIRARKDGSQPYIVAVTGVTSSRDRMQISDAGIDAYIAKPVDLAELANALQQAWVRKSGDDSTVVPGDAAADEPVELQLEQLQANRGAAAEGLLRRVIPTYLRELPAREQGLREALAKRDIDKLAQLCHGLKGASRVVGAAALARECERLESGAYDGRLSSAEEIERLLDVAQRTAQELRRRLD